MSKLDVAKRRLNNLISQVYSYGNVLISGMRSLFRRVKTKTTYIMKPPSATLDLFDVLDRGLQRQYAESDAERVKLRHEVERLKKEIEWDEYTEIDKLAKEHFKELKKERELRTLKLKIVGDYLPTWFLRNDQVYKLLSLKGFVLFQGDGYLLWYPWLVGDNGKEFIPTKGATSFTQLFRGNNPVTQIKGGKFDSNYFYDSYDLYLIPDKKVDVESGQGVNIIHLAEQEREQYISEIENLKEYVSGLMAQLRQYQSKEIEYQKEINEAKLTSDTLAKMADSYKGSIAVMAEKSATMTDNLTKALTATQDATVDRMLAENLLTRMKDTIQSLNRDLSEAMAGVDKPIQRKVREQMNEVMGIMGEMARVTKSKEGEKK